MDVHDLSPAEDPQALMLEDRGIADFLQHLTVLGEKLFADDGSVPCGLVSQRGNRGVVVTSSSSAAARLDEVHHAVGEGPALQAIAAGGVVVVEDALQDPRWPAYLPIAVSMDCTSVLSVPLQVGSEGFAALTFYARSAGFFTSDRQRIAAVFAEQAGKALEMAMRVARHQDRSADMLAAMGTRTSIDVAVGIIIAQNKCTQEEAFTILKRASSTRNTKVNKVAEDLILRASGVHPTTHFTN